MAINRLLSRNEQRHFFNFLLDQLGDQLSCWFSAIIQYPLPASISSAERLPILLIVTIQFINSYFKSLFIAQKDTHGESFFYLFDSIKKEQLETSLWFDGAGMVIRKGSIYWVDFSAGKGSKPIGRGRGIVIQIDLLSGSNINSLMDEVHEGLKIVMDRP